MQSKKVAQLFWQAQQFLSVLRQFSKGDGSAGSEAELPGDLQEKYVYAKWKTADIISHVKRGERPAPGPPGGDDGGSGGSENEGGMAGEGKMAATGEDEGKSTGSMSLGGGSSGGDGGGAWDLPPPPAMTPHASSEGSSSGTGGSLRGGGGGGGGLNMPGAADAPPAYPSVSAGSTAPATANVNGDRKPASEPMNILSYAASGDGGKVDADVARLLAGAKVGALSLTLSLGYPSSFFSDPRPHLSKLLLSTPHSTHTHTHTHTNKTLLTSC